MPSESGQPTGNKPLRAAGGLFLTRHNVWFWGLGGRLGVASLLSLALWGLVFWATAA
jgi:hypothetical protein